VGTKIGPLRKSETHGGENSRGKGKAVRGRNKIGADVSCNRYWSKLLREVRGGGRDRWGEKRRCEKAGKLFASSKRGGNTKSRSIIEKNLGAKRKDGHLRKHEFGDGGERKGGRKRCRLYVP